MALGILEPRVEHVPGTVYVYESEQRHAELLQAARHLKRDRTGRMILVPQPSDDPNDPLVSRDSMVDRLRTTDLCRTGLSGNATLSLESSALCHVSRLPLLLYSRQILSPLPCSSSGPFKMRHF